MCISSRSLMPPFIQMPGVAITRLPAATRLSVIKMVNGQEMPMLMVSVKSIQILLKVYGRPFATFYGRFGVFIKSFSPAILLSVSSLLIAKSSPLCLFQNLFKYRNAFILDISEEINRKIASIRIRVEHAISGVKRYRIVKDKLRNWKKGFCDLVMETCSGLHNFRQNFRPWRYETPII